MDLLSSTATVAGYHAVLLAAETLPKLFPMLVTAAGTLTPARVLVIGAGVAGLQAIATARRLGGGLRGRDRRHHQCGGRLHDHRPDAPHVQVQGPGHMNVLLAEANIPYDRLFDMDQINQEFANADVALVIGANDVVNPAARSDRSSPIYGMPILNADQAHNVIVLKRSMDPGFAGIENALFYDPKTALLFGDAKTSLTKLVTEMKGA